MKYFFILLSVFAFSKNGLAQITGGNVFQAQNIYTGYVVNGNDIVLPTFKTNAEVEGNPYFSKDWIKGSVKTTDNKEFGKNLVFTYDKEAGKLYFKNQDSATIMEADKSRISSFTLITDKPHLFMRGDLFSRDYAGKFFEVLVLDDTKYSLLKYTTTSFEKPATSRASQAMTESLSNGKYVDNVSYFLYRYNNLKPVQLKKKTFPKELDSDTINKAEDYIKNNNSNFNESYIIKMLEHINEQIQ